MYPHWDLRYSRLIAPGFANHVGTAIRSGTEQTAISSCSIIFGLRALTCLPTKIFSWENIAWRMNKDSFSVTLLLWYGLQRRSKRFMSARLAPISLDHKISRTTIYVLVESQSISKLRPTVFCKELSFADILNIQKFRYKRFIETWISLLKEVRKSPKVPSSATVIKLPGKTVKLKRKGKRG